MLGAHDRLENTIGHKMKEKLFNMVKSKRHMDLRIIMFSTESLLHLAIIHLYRLVDSIFSLLNFR